MPNPFRGVVNVDIRDSVPDWEPFLQPEAPEGAPNVLNRAAPTLHTTSPRSGPTATRAV